MPSGSTNLLKREKVKMEGQCSVGHSGAGVAPSVRPGARIVERNDNGAVIEVTCGCGEKIYLHCTYAGK